MLPTVSGSHIVFATGRADARLFPTHWLSRAYRRVLRGHEGAHLLDYGDPRGHPRLVNALRTLLAERRSVHATETQMLITRGSQMALSLAAEAVLQAGDSVLVEELGYPPAWSAMERTGARLLAAPLDGEGVDVDAAKRLSNHHKVKAIYLTPHHQYPTTVTLASHRRMQLLAWAKKEHIAIIEDDYDHEVHYEGRPVAPLASADLQQVIYIGTLSKSLAPGLRLGFMAGPNHLIERCISLRKHLDRQGDQTVERAVAELIEDGDFASHARKTTQTYAIRRACLIDEIERVFPGVFDLVLAQGGMALWLKIRDPRQVDVDQWATEALHHGVVFAPAKRFALDQKPRAALRLGFASLDESEIREGIRRMKKAFRTICKRS